MPKGEERESPPYDHIWVTVSAHYPNMVIDVVRGGATTRLQFGWSDMKSLAMAFTELTSRALDDELREWGPFRIEQEGNDA